jgi:aryl-phospho-beta-D-glucosidase BglC (GH1 family)
LSRGIYVSLSPWQFNAASADTDITYDSASFTAANFADFWGKFAYAIHLATGGDQRVAFDLINEPHTHAESGNRAGDIGISLANWSAASQAAITAIRAYGVSNTIFWPGMSYTGASDFLSNGSAAAFLALTDPLSNLAVSVHCYDQFNAHSTSATSHRNACSALVTWARTNKVLVQIGEIASDTGGDHSVSSGQAAAAWADWEAFQAANSDVLVGWCWWGVSQAGWWASDDYHWGPTLDNGSTTTKYWTLIGSSMGTT